jgi:hypothetical protein
MINKTSSKDNTSVVGKTERKYSFAIKKTVEVFYFLSSIILFLFMVANVYLFYIFLTDEDQQEDKHPITKIGIFKNNEDQQEDKDSTTLETNETSKEAKSNLYKLFEEYGIISFINEYGSIYFSILLMVYMMVGFYIEYQKKQEGAILIKRAEKLLKE